MKIGNPPVNTPFLLPGADTINPVWHEWLANIATQLSGTVLLPATTAEIKAGAVSDKGVTPTGLLAAVGFSAYFQSAEQTITSSGALTIAHGLGREPILYAVVLKCLTAEHGYSVGDKLVIPWSISNSATDNRWFSLVVNATNLNIRFGSNATVFNNLNKTTGAGVDLTNANWSFIIRCWG